MRRLFTRESLSLPASSVALVYIRPRSASALSIAASISSIQVDSAGTAAIAALTTVAAVPALFPGVGSFSDAVTEAVLETVVAVLGILIVSVMVAVEPFVIEPSAHETVVVPLHEPCVVVAETKVVPAGRASVMTTFVAPVGPLLVTVIV